MLKRFVLLAAACAVIFTGCGQTSASEENYEKVDDVFVNRNSVAQVLILGNHANSMQAPQELYDTLEKNFDDVVYGGDFSIIIADSTPTKIEVESNKFFTEDRKNVSAVSHEIGKRKNKLIRDIKEAAKIMADSPETDLLEAIREAKSVLSNTNSNKKQILIADTGISTCGDLNLCNINFNENPSERRDPESIVEEYLLNCEGKNVLPDLSGTDVIFYGAHQNLAPAASPQSDNMITTDEQYIKELWENIITKCGANVSFVEIAGWDTPIMESEEIPHVSTVTFKRLIPTTGDPNELDGSIVGAADINLSISNSEIGFSPDNTSLVSQDNFTNQYQELAMQIEAYLSGNAENKIYIAGAVAKFGDDNGYQLSRERAEVIKKLLTNGSFKDNNGNEIKIPPEQIYTIGLGDKFPDKINEYPNGEFDKVLAAENRKVFIFNKPSDDDSTNYYFKIKSAYEGGELNPETIKDLDKLFN